MNYTNVKNIKSQLINTHFVGYQAQKIKEIHLSRKLRWITHAQQNTQRSEFFKRLSRRKKSFKELSFAKAKENQIKSDISIISLSKDSKKCTETDRDPTLKQMKHFNQTRHNRQDSQVQLRTTNIFFDVKKSVQKGDLIRNRKMSLPVRCGPILPPKINSKKSCKENNELIASLFTQKIDSNHPEVQIRKVISQRPKSHFYRSNSEILPPKKLKSLHAKTNQNNDFEIKPWQQTECCQYQIIL